MKSSNSTIQIFPICDFRIKLSHFLDFLTDFIEATNNQTQLPNHNCFIELLTRIYINLQGIEVLLPKLDADRRFKLSINLLFRSVVDDLINVYYLRSCTVINEAEQTSLGNELSILHKEFLSSFKKLIEAEALCYDKDPVLILKDTERQIIKENPNLYDNGKLKTNKQIRETSNTQLQEELKDFTGHFISETQKLKHIGKIMGWIENPLIGEFKYLSQFHHYTQKSFQFILTESSFDIDTYNKCLISLFDLISSYFTFVELADKEKLKGRFDEMHKVASLEIHRHN